MAANPLVQLGISLLLGLQVAILGSRELLRLVAGAVGVMILAGGALFWFWP